MIKTPPDKWIRKAVYDAVNNIVVDSLTIPCFDTQVPAGTEVDHYILLTTQTNDVSRLTKCEDSWISTILIDVVTSYSGVGNPGSRLLADNIMAEVLRLTDEITLDVSSGLEIQRRTETMPNDIATITKTENIFRKLLRIELTIN